MARRGLRRRKVRRFTAERRAAFLEHLRRTGNQTAAAKALGFDRTVPEQRRKRDAAFELECRAAEAEAHRNLAGAEDAFDHPGNARFETLRRGRGGRMQIVATRTGKWSKEIEDIFLEVLRGCGNIAGAARAIGFSESVIWTRRRRWPAFALRIEAALEEAELVLEFRLATLGNNVGAGLEGGQDPDAGIEPTPGSPIPGPSLTERGSEPFDPEFALRFLKWREAKRQGGGHRGRQGSIPPEPDIETVRARILAKLDAIERHQQPRLIAEGWSRDEEGRMIPPGWVRREG